MSSELGLGGCGEDGAVRCLLGGSVEREEGTREGDVVSGRHCATVRSAFGIGGGEKW